MQQKRLSNLRKISPFRSFNFTKTKGRRGCSSSNQKRSIIVPARDPVHLHYCLENMRGSVRYLKKEDNFTPEFFKHLEHTGYDRTGSIVRREYYNNKPKRMIKYGFAEYSSVDYPSNFTVKQQKKLHQKKTKGKGKTDGIRPLSHSVDNLHKIQKMSDTVKKGKQKGKDVLTPTKKRSPSSFIKIQTAEARSVSQEIEEDNEDKSKLTMLIKRFKKSRKDEMKQEEEKRNFNTSTKKFTRAKAMQSYTQKRADKRKLDKQKPSERFKRRNLRFRSHSLEKVPNLSSAIDNNIVYPSIPEILRYKDTVKAPFSPLKYKKMAKTIKTVRDSSNNKKLLGRKVQRSMRNKYGNQTQFMKIDNYWDVDPAGIHRSVDQYHETLKIDLKPRLRTKTKDKDQAETTKVNQFRIMKKKQLLKNFQQMRKSHGFTRKFPKMTSTKGLYVRATDNDYNDRCSKDGFYRNPHGGRPFPH